MLSSAALLALCVQVADLSSLYLSFEPSGQYLEQQMDHAEVRWVEALRTETVDDASYVAAMHDGFRDAMAMDGQAMWAQWEQCLIELAPSQPGRKG